MNNYESRRGYIPVSRHDVRPTVHTVGSHKRGNFLIRENECLYGDGSQ